MKTKTNGRVKVVGGMLATCLWLAPCALLARQPNYDETKVAPYVLEDPLAFADGRKLASPAEWPARRAEIVKIFEREMYGRTPPAPEAVVFDLREEGPTLAGLAIRRQYRMWFKADKSGPFVDWLVVIPNRISGMKPVIRDGRVVCENKGKVPVILALNYRGNQEMLTDEEIEMPEGVWVRDHAVRFCFENRPSRWTRAAARNTQCASPMPIETIVARGYALVTACYGQISPDIEVKEGDPEGLAYTGVFSLWPKRDPDATDNITALGAWAWTLSRGLDLAERIPEIDAKKSVATGCSRLAKTPLLACSRDERFAVCVPCQTGGGGCPLAKRDFGENVSTEMKMFPHWYCRAYGKYVDNEQAMKFDQHLLLASIAPRALLVEGFNNGWFDTKGEYLACRAAAPVWKFLGKGTMPEGGFPENYDTSLIGESFGYVRRGGEHGISGSDWQWMLDFADGVFGRRAPGAVRNPVWPHDAPDPTVWEDGKGTCYLASTHQDILESDDLVTWRKTGKKLLDPSEYARIAKTWPHVWAPAVKRIGEWYVLYLSFHNTGAHTAVVSYRSKSPTGPFRDRNTLVTSEGDGKFEVIDPDVAFEDGRAFLFFGHGDVRRVELTPDGLSRKPGAPIEHVAGLALGRKANSGLNGWKANGTEGSYLYRRDGWWYLFVSEGNWGDHTYRVSVGRARKLTDAFFDRDGRPMADAAATPILSSAKGDAFYGPGHNGEIVSRGGRTFMFYHCHWTGCASMADGVSNVKVGSTYIPRVLLLQEIFWDAEGWPFFGNGGKPDPFVAVPSAGER